MYKELILSGICTAICQPCHLDFFHYAAISTTYEWHWKQEPTQPCQSLYTGDAQPAISTTTRILNQWKSEQCPIVQTGSDGADWVSR